jgi:hypothetical protein
MSPHRLAVSLALLQATFVCSVALAAPPAEGDRAATAFSGASTAMKKDESDAAGVACRTDTDCPHLACGPCTPGTPITKEMLGGPACAVNPCLDASAVCSADHRCEIGPGTRKNPKVWGRPPA